ncbi:ABC transporter ATP-binding protein [Candidatus Acidulodesulfobacterium sp. H_13]|uniref:ABC transporter ATP-binding protein n=1 Tax=Candidatus Acidulodesulfobacterium sp. H_13 TaxID=3395470 RepID=UPI003AF656DF
MPVNVRSNNSEVAVSVMRLVKKYKDVVAVNDISFSVNKGEFFAFLGPNGAGKTTTIKILCTLIRQTSGNVYINGYDTIRNRKDVRMSIGLVFQDPTLDNDLSALENLNFHARLYGMNRESVGERIDHILDFIDLYDYKDKPIKLLSGGMKRRLEVGRGLLHSPSVLFLDEPTAGLDIQTRINMWDFIDKLRKEEETTVFLTTHYIEEAENCDRIAVIDKGKIIAIDTPSELKKSVKSKDGNVPTLSDAFISLVGREVRGEAGTAIDRMRELNRVLRR